MFKTISEIKSARNKFENAHLTLYSRWNDDYNLWRLKPYSAGKGYFSYTSNSPRVLADKVVALLCEAKLNIRIPTGKLLEEERRIASDLERFLYGALSLNDERLMRLNRPPLRDAWAWLAAVRGQFAFRVFVKKDGKKTIPELIPWDCYKTAYDIGEKGVIWATHTRKATRESVISEYPDIKIGDKDEIEVIDYWDTKNNGVIVENVWAKNLEPHELDHCPVYVVFVGASPPIISNEYADTEAERGQSIFASNRNLYAPYNKTMSDLLNIVRRGVKRPKQVKSADGKYTLDVDIDQTEKAAAISTTQDVEIKPIYEERMPADAAGLFQLISGEMQRGGLPHTVYGELGFRLSGYAINQLQSSILTVVSPTLQAIERAYRLSCDELISQFASGGFDPIEVMGRTSKNEIFGYPIRERIKASDLKEDWRPEVNLIPTLPKDDAQRYQLANLARTGEPPLLSMDTIRDEVLNIEDPDLEREKIDEEWGSNIPLIRLQKTFQACIARGRLDLASLVLAEIRKLLAQMEAQLPQQTSAKQPTTLGSASMETTGAGLPAEGEQGLSPEVLPPEASGGLPGGAIAE